MKRTRRILLHAISASLAGTVIAAGARAQSNLPQAVVAKGLYEQAMAAMGRKDHEAACPMLEEAIRLEPAALGARLALAECYEVADKLASAWGAYGIVEREAIKANQADRQIKAHERAAALQPRFAYLVIEVNEAVSRLPGLTIKRDGVPVGPAQYGVPLPADKGSHLITVEARGRHSVQRTFEILADGVTGRATISEPPRSSEPMPSWGAPGAPGAPPPLRYLLPLQPPPLPPQRQPPPPLQRGVPVILLIGPGGTELREVAPSGSEIVCSGTCGARVDARDNKEFFLAGDAFVDSPRFQLNDRIGEVRINVSPGSRTQRTWSIAAMTFGSAAAIGCGTPLPVAKQFDAAAPGVLGACLGAGLLSLAIGIPVFLGSRTTYSISPSNQSGGVGVLHF